MFRRSGPGHMVLYFGLFTLKFIYLFNYLFPKFGLKDVLDFIVMYCSTISKRYFCTLVQMYSFFFLVEPA